VEPTLSEAGGTRHQYKKVTLFSLSPMNSKITYFIVLFASFLLYSLSCYFIQPPIMSYVKLQFDEKGAALDVLKVVTVEGIPQAKGKEVVVNIKASSINPGVFLWIAGMRGREKEKGGVCR